MDLLTLHFARHALAQQVQANPALIPALAATDDEIRRRVVAADADPSGPPDHGALTAALYGVARSGHWHTVEEEFREKHPTCAAGGAGPIQVHHVNPFHYVIALGRPDLELDERNLIGLTEGPNEAADGEYHLLLGHRGNFQLGSLSVREDAAGRFHGVPCAAIRQDPSWLAIEPIKALDEMDDDEKRAFRDRLDAEFPPIGMLLQRFGLEIKPYGS